jgi:hypothetical protein
MYQTIDQSLDFINDLYKILSTNEKVLYNDSKMSKDKYYKNVIGKLLLKYLSLPEDYMTVSKEGFVVEKSHILLHRALTDIFCKLQKKYYGNEDLFGIEKKSNYITSFYEDTSYICETYIYSNFNTKFLDWIKAYNEDLVYVETETYKYYGFLNKKLELNSGSYASKTFKF